MAVADNGTAVSLVTMAAAKWLKLHIYMNLKPDLFPIWSDKAYQSIRRDTVCLQVEGGPKFWEDAVVVDMKVPWELLVSNHAQEGLDICLMTLANSPMAPVLLAQDLQMFLLMDGLPNMPLIKEP
ncbi:hypothetical protein LPJ66_002314, partial [Kickxella alabastrina]